MGELGCMHCAIVKCEKLHWFVDQEERALKHVKYVYWQAKKQKECDEEREYETWKLKVKELDYRKKLCDEYENSAEKWVYVRNLEDAWGKGNNTVR